MSYLVNIETDCPKVCHNVVSHTADFFLVLGTK